MTKMFVLLVLAYATVVAVNAAPATLISPSMTTVDLSKAPIAEKPLYKPTLDEVVEVLSVGLAKNFETVSVSVSETPDLTQPPYYLTSPGLTGSETIVEIGGPPYLLPLVQRDKTYDLAELIRLLHGDSGFLAGAGAGPWQYVGVNSEGIINLTIRDGQVNQGTRIVTVHPVGAAKGSSGYLQKQLPNNETRNAMLGNYLLSEGKPGKVIKVIAKKRIGPANFIQAIRETLRDKYGDKIVGMGGMFLLRSGKVKFHVMPDFSKTPLCSDADLVNWLHYFEMSAPITHVGTLVTGEYGLDLRVQHFHGFSAHGDGGHYHTDTTPDDAEYEGYFVLGSKVIRIDPPQQTHLFGRD